MMRVHLRLTRPGGIWYANKVIERPHVGEMILDNAYVGYEYVVEMVSVCTMEPYVIADVRWAGLEDTFPTKMRMQQVGWSWSENSNE